MTMATPTTKKRPTRSRRQKWRRKCGEEAVLQMPHPALPDPTPRQVQVLLDQLSQEKYHEWCTDEYSMAEEPSDDEDEE